MKYTCVRVCAFVCKYIKFKSIPACPHRHFYNPYDDVCISLRVLCPRMSACAHVCACVQYWSAGLRPVCMCPCVYVCVCVPGEPMAGQRFSPDQGYVRGGDADDRQPLRFCLPPLLLSSTHLQRLQGPPTRGTTLNTPEHTCTCSTHTHTYTQ